MKKLWKKLSQNNTNLVAASVIILLAIFLITNPPKPATVNNESAQPAPATSSVAPAEKPKNLAYKGETGKTALELLSAKAQIETSGSGEMAFVTTINGYKPDVKKEFWSFYVNGKQAEVGAGSFKTKDTDLIEWRLEEIKAQ